MSRILPPEHWLCVDCNKDTSIDPRDYYMIQHDLWNKFGAGRKLVCMDCIEVRLGHPLTASDILDCHLNEFINPYTQKILGKTISLD